MNSRFNATDDLSEFERIINDTHEPLAFFSRDDDICLVRAPARLDVMGGIADYSGAHVCEATLGKWVILALQPRSDQIVRIRSVPSGKRCLPIETSIPLECLQPARNITYGDVRDVVYKNPLTSWAGYIVGSMFALLKEYRVDLRHGFNILIISGVPMNVGIASSAAVEIATLTGMNAYLKLGLNAFQIAQLGQITENHVIGAPCGIMDQLVIAGGNSDRLTHILCRPGSLEGEVSIPENTGFVGISSMIQHRVSGNPYVDTRIGAFMGKRIINQHLSDQGEAPVEHLAEITPELFHATCASLLPETLKGSTFLESYGSHDDPVTHIEPETTYRVIGPTRHPVEENDRVLRFMAALSDADGGNRDALITAGECLYGAHASYRDHCDLSTEEVDFLVEAVRKRGPQNGLYGAKITGGGTGGTVAVFGETDALAKHIPDIASEYQQHTGLTPDIFTGRSPGALSFGSRTYRFKENQWQIISTTDEAS